MLTGWHYSVTFHVLISCKLTIGPDIVSAELGTECEIQCCVYPPQSTSQLEGVAIQLSYNSGEVYALSKLYNE